MNPHQITIAITVYNRRTYLEQAIASALNQTVLVKVMVVEDCGPDPTLQDFVIGEFGSRVQYVRNPRRRGLFGNWNACLELCQTEWLTILHDDDYLTPDFVAAMIELERCAPGLSLYLGRVPLVDRDGRLLAQKHQDDRVISGAWTERGLKDILYMPFPFAGHLFRVQDVRRMGGFRDTSFLCGDWEMFTALTALRGAAQTATIVGYCRDHGGFEKGTNKAIREGRQYPTSYLQHKRILRLMAGNRPQKFDRRLYVTRFPLPTRFLLRYGASLSPRLLRYHVRLLSLSPAPHAIYALFQMLARIGGVPFVRVASRCWNRFHNTNPAG